MPRMNKLSRNNTAIINKNGNTSVILHGTVVVEFDHEAIILRTGGWFSATTKTRMNQASNQYGLGYRVSQTDGAWSVHYNGADTAFVGNELVIPR